MAEDNKNPKEASNIFHSIMKASVSKPVSSDKLKRGVDIFTKNKAREIKNILLKVRASERNEQKKLRSDLRDRLKFYIEDFTNKKGFTSEDFDTLVKQGRITIK